MSALARFNAQAAGTRAVQQASSNPARGCAAQGLSRLCSEGCRGRRRQTTVYDVAHVPLRSTSSRHYASGSFCEPCFAGRALHSSSPRHPPVQLAASSTAGRAVTAQASSTSDLHVTARQPEAELSFTRTLLADLAVLAEQLVYADLSEDFFDFDPQKPADQQVMLENAEASRDIFPMGGRVNEIPERPQQPMTCEVRRRRRVWAHRLKQSRDCQVVHWVDTAVRFEKQAAVLTWQRGGGGGGGGGGEAAGAGPETRDIVIVLRGTSKSADLVTDFTPYFVPFPAAGTRHVAPGSEDFMPDLADSSAPCVSLGVWRAYAGDEEAVQVRPEDTPRARILAAVEALLRGDPARRVIVTGHSLGGSLATVCAMDLLEVYPALRGRLSLVTFGAPRLVNAAFQRQVDAVEGAGHMEALRVVVKGDITPLIPPPQTGCLPGVSRCLVLDPENPAAPVRLEESRALVEEDVRLEATRTDKNVELVKYLVEAMQDIDMPTAHVRHATLLEGSVSPGRSAVIAEELWSQTLPDDDVM